ncbi:3-hydroxy-3-methylglutaryl-CoA lyase [Intrasporangium oryzae NRRL B-24470]|uniref:3-hydroxy-3-methylglutaryl-CoA lyase n=1 Tax=Intrasporangium oryzae NRRL B-24470 TaxID=1386089 RepID=W9G954_9MICO|nr:hydroxymethylglutaryl-CoA lyase [Intrasporangium oryzae]EWT02555.1 3-hydroxy-3-methylglutaryl-CoA lyase [Intrasporangium oryzae NRRL B-24470]
MKQTVEILEVSPRDGLQNEKTILTTEDKIELVERAVRSGARRIEVTSFVNPARVPQMADADDVMSALPRQPGLRYAGLVMNRRGLERALAGRVDEIDVVVVATDTFCRRNQGMSTVEACDMAAALVADARSAGVFTTITVGASFGCPFEGEVSIERLREVVQRVVDAGPDELALADTIGVAVPTDVKQRLEIAREIAGPDIPLRLHLHDTRHTGVANAVAALEVGVTTLDASIGGAGGCPFAPKATGNVATEDLVYLFDRMGVRTGLDLESVTDTVAWLEERLAKTLPGALARAGGFPAS